MKPAHLSVIILTLIAYSVSSQDNYLKKKKEAASLNLEGVDYQSAGNYDSSIYYYKKAAEVYGSIGDTLSEVGCYINTAKSYRDISQFEESLNLLLQAASKLESCCQSSNKRIAYLNSCYTTIASIHRFIDNYQKAEEYYFKILDHISEDTSRNVSEIRARCLNNLGNLYMSWNKNVKAREYFMASLQERKHAKDQHGIERTISNLGVVNLRLGNYNEAEDQLLQALTIKEENGDKKGIAFTLNQLGNLYTILKKYKKASYYLQKSESIIREIGTLDLMIDNLDFRIKLYNATHPDRGLAELYDEYILLKDSLLNKDKAESLAEMQVKYETEKKQQEIAMLQQGQELQKAEIELRQSWIIRLAMMIVLVLMVVLFVYTRFRREKKNKRKVETLMQEVQHRIKNNLQLLSSLLSLQTRTLDDEKAIMAIKSGESRINTMAIIHQKLNSAQKYTELNINEYINDIIAYLSQAYGYEVKQDAISVQVVDMHLDVEIVIPLGLIVNELVSNSFKYAFPDQPSPELCVELIQINGKKLCLRIKDNGPGFREDLKRPESMGLKIIATLVRQLKGGIRQNMDSGLETIVEVPLK